MSKLSLSDIEILLLAPSRVLSIVLQHELQILGLSHITVVFSIKEALHTLPDSHVHAIIGSMYFEDGDMIDLLQLLKHRGLATDAQVLLVSSEAREQRLQQAIDAGVNAVLPRPFQREDLEQALAKVLS